MTKQKTYRINECFYSLQGEGARAGTANVFLRFSGCNLTCRKENEGFDCDTEFISGRDLSLDEVIKVVKQAGRYGSRHADWVILTGGEPSLQTDEDLIDRLHAEGFKIAIETNGTYPVSPKIDWVTVSPKTAEHTIRQETADEVKYVRSHGMGIPKPKVKAEHYLISPAYEGDELPPENLDWCMKLIKENPSWRLSVQQHKSWNIR